MFQRHRAGGDALATAEIFLHLLARLEENGIKDLASAREFEFPPAPATDSGPKPQLLPLVAGF